MIELIDVSHHQGRIDFAALAQTEIAGVIVKAIDGRLPDVDPRFRENWRAITERRDRFVRGSYAFARPATDGGGAADGRAEAEDYARTMTSEAWLSDDWIAVIDLERGGMDEGHTEQQNVDFLSAWVETCERELGRSPWIYTGKHAWLRLGWTSAFDHLHLWQADYTSSPAPMPWPLTLWQYTSEGRVPGVATRVDLNRFDGTIDAMRQLERERIIVRGQPGPRSAIFPWLDLAGSGPYDPHVADVQALLHARGYGPDGLIDRATGRPDGKRGPSTRAAYAAATGNDSTVVDWVALLASHR